jgi:tetratricopeptide (TPR) repeat protein
MVRWSVLLLIFLQAGNLIFAAPGEIAPRESRLGTPVEAEKHYRNGLRHRDAAWVYEEKLSGTKDAKDRAAYAQFIQRTYLRALEEFKRAIEIDPKFYQAFSSLGYAYRKTGDVDAALAAYGQALSLNPGYAEAIEYRAEAYLELGRIDDAKQAYEVVAPLKPAYAVRLLQFAETIAGQMTDDEKRQELLAWVADKREKLGTVKEVIEKW